MEFNDVIIQAGEAFEELQVIVSGEASNSMHHWSNLEHNLQKDDRLDLLDNLVETSITMAALRLSLKGSFKDYALDELATFLKYAKSVGYNTEKYDSWATKALLYLLGIKTEQKV